MSADALMPADAGANGERELELVRAILPVSLSCVLDEADSPSQPFADNAAYLRTLEAHMTLLVSLFKLSSECTARVVSHSSRDFCDGAASTVQRALGAIPTVRHWTERLSARLATRGRLPLADSGLLARFERLADVYELSPAERRILGALFAMRTSHAFASVKLGSQVSYAAGSPLYAGASKPGVSLSNILGVALADLANFQKAERRHVKQGIVLPSQQLLSEVPAVQQEVVLLLLALPLSESQIFNIEKVSLKLLSDDSHTTCAMCPIV